MSEKQPKGQRFGVVRQMLFFFEAMLVIPAAALAGILPMETGRRLAKIVGKTAFHLSKRGKRNVRSNLDVMFGENRLPDDKKRKIGSAMFESMCVCMFEFLKIKELAAGDYRKFIYAESIRPLREAAQMGKGTLLIGAHLGNWEWMAAGCRLEGYPLGVVIYRQWNPFTDRWLRKTRENGARGVKSFYNEPSGLIEMVRHLKNNGMVAILADEPYRSNPVHVPFFGKTTAAARGPALLHLRYGSPVVFAFPVRQADGRYRVTLDGPHVFPKSGDEEQDCVRFMTWVNRVFETVIRKHPEQWFLLQTARWDD